MLSSQTAALHTHYAVYCCRPGSAQLAAHRARLAPTQPHVPTGRAKHSHQRPHNIPTYLCSACREILLRQSSEETEFAQHSTPAATANTARASALSNAADAIHAKPTMHPQPNLLTKPAAVLATTCLHQSKHTAPACRPLHKHEASLP